LLTDLADLFPTLGSPTPQFSFVASDAWLDRWRDHFPPLAVGEHFLVLPPWLPTPADSQRISLIIDPSLAFGTGHHATTQGCLEAIELLHNTYGCPAQALDLGTGAGILAIALVKLGTPHVFATDIDPIALDEARKNSSANGASSGIHFSDLSLEQLPMPFALIVANLFSSTLVALALSLHAGVQPQGHAILSGIQLDQEQEVLAAYGAPAWRLVQRFPQDEWVTLVLQRT
jgi:ribosomal protein L11 methyltransferase